MMVVVRACLGRVVSGCDGCIVVVVSVQRGTKLFFIRKMIGAQMRSSVDLNLTFSMQTLKESPLDLEIIRKSSWINGFFFPKESLNPSELLLLLACPSLCRVEECLHVYCAHPLLAVGA